MVPRAGALPDDFLGCMASLTSAPAFSRTRTTSVRPSRTAKNRGVNPEGSGVRKSAPACEQRLDDRRMPLGRRPHQGRLPAPFPGVDVGPPGEQRLHGPELPGARGGHQGRLVAAEPRVRVGAGVEQQLDHRLVRRSCRPARGASRRSGSRP